MTYKEQIRSPEWIKFATSLKEAKNWTCEHCGERQSRENELTVHHIYYMNGVMMWDHPEEILEVLCWGCHQLRQSTQQERLAEFAAALKGKSTLAMDFMKVVPAPPAFLMKANEYEVWSEFLMVFQRIRENTRRKNPSLADVFDRASLYSATGQKWFIGLRDDADLEIYYSHRGCDVLKRELDHYCGINPQLNVHTAPKWEMCHINAVLEYPPPSDEPEDDQEG